MDIPESVIGHQKVHLEEKKNPKHEHHICNNLLLGNLALNSLTPAPRRAVKCFLLTSAAVVSDFSLQQWSSLCILSFPLYFGCVARFWCSKQGSSLNVVYWFFPNFPPCCVLGLLKPTRTKPANPRTAEHIFPEYSLSSLPCWDEAQLCCSSKATSQAGNVTSVQGVFIEDKNDFSTWARVSCSSPNISELSSAIISDHLDWLWSLAIPPPLPLVLSWEKQVLKNK